jgi:glycosyltransferase involved in cell wall biosynthesis
MTGPSVTVAIPVLNEANHIEQCLEAVRVQTYDNIVEILVIDGGSADDTRSLARSFDGVEVLDNPRRIQSAALNVALDVAKGDVMVRVDGHCQLESDYIERCVSDLEATSAAMVGGGMTPMASGRVQQGIALAMSSRFGAGPARFHVSGSPGWVDTIYLGAYRTELARQVDGYAEDVGVNEDAEFAIRMRPHGGIWFDPDIKSTYVPRESLRAVARQFYRYGRSRAATIRRHPGSLSARQLAAPALVLGLLSSRRRVVLLGYASVLATAAAIERRRAGSAMPSFVAALPIMHLSWGTGFLVGLAKSLFNEETRR